jgi:tetratricopeptide (TPR) repeat protein
MKKMIVLAVAALLAAPVLFAQTSAQEYLSRYALLVGRLGPAGVGVETLVNRWEADFPDDVEMLCAKYNYYHTKCQGSAVVQKDQDHFMGTDPILTLKDSTGKDVRYFTETTYDDEMYGIATQALDKAIRLRGDDISLRFTKIASLLAYEKESPDMATQALRSLIDYHCTSHPSWKYGENAFSDDDFRASMKDYCFVLFRTGSPSSLESFKSVSEKLLSYYPKDTDFLNNLGSYYLVARKDYKTAVKYYSKTLKLDPDNYGAIKNCVLAARKQGNPKQEKKYLQMLVRVSPDELERNSAKIRLEAMK